MTKCVRKHTPQHCPVNNSPGSAEVAEIIWARVLEFPNYEVSSDGRVKSVPREVKGRRDSKRKIKGRELKPWLDHRGYKTVSLWLNNKGLNRRIHRLVGLAFIGNHAEFDHIDRNILNNNMSNLRPCTHQQNAFNTSSRKGTSKYKGVSWCKKSKKWQAHIMVNSHSKGLGRYTSEVEAAITYNKAARKYFGEFAYQNTVEK